MSSAITATVIGGVTAKSAADDAQHALDASATAQREAEAAGAAQIRADFEPYREAGSKALSRLEGLMYGDTDISDTASYQFRLEEGYKGVERSQAGRRLSGRAAKEMMNYGQGAASQEYENEVNRLQEMANMGQASAAQQATQTGASTARTSSIEGDYGANTVELTGTSSDALQSSLSDLSTAWQNYNA